LKVKVTERPALVRVAASSQQITGHAGLVLVRELWDRLGLSALLDALTVKRRRRGYSPAQTMLALVETLIAGGECLDDAALLRADSGQQQLRGHAVPDPTTLGRFLARFNLGHIAQLNRALEQLFARIHPLVGREQVTLDLDSTLVEHHGPVGSRQGTRGTYAGKVAWHPLLCFVAESGEWLHAKLRNGHAAASTGAKRFLCDCLRRLPEGVRLFLRADEGFYGQDFLAALEDKGITYAVGAPIYRALRERLAAIDEADWRRSSYREGSEVASFAWKPKTWERERRFVVRRDPVEHGEQLSLEGSEWHYWALVTNDAERSADELESWHRDKANVENRVKEVKLGLGLDNLPCKGFHANWAYLLATLLAYNLLTWLKLLALPEGERHSYSKRLRFRFIAVAATVGRSGRRLVLRLAAGYPLLADFLGALRRLRGLARAPA
jgi:Transposase DDE domain group 1